MKYVQILASTFAFAAAAALLVQMHGMHEPTRYPFVILFLLCGANLLSRLTETAIGDQIAEAEEKVAKRVLRRLAKVMPELLDGYFKAGAEKPAERLSDVVVAPKQDALTIQKERCVEYYRKLSNAQPKCTVECDAQGTKIITVQPGCTAADVNAAAGADIAR